MEEVTALIIPSDGQPGAREAGIVFALDRAVSGSRRDRKQYRNGLKWLDDVSLASYGKKGFLHLSVEEKIDVLKTAESGEARSFFDRARRQTVEMFYTSAAGWKSVGYHGPPQWSGNRDYHRCAQEMSPGGRTEKR